MISFENFLQVIGVVIAVFSFCGVIFQYAVIRPIENKLSDLTHLNKSIRDALNLHAERVHSLELKLTELEVKLTEIERRIKAEHGS